MYPRSLEPPRKGSFFLFGPRGVGKSAWVRSRFPGAPVFDLLDHRTYSLLLADPRRLGDLVPEGHRGPVVLDEVQRVPELLNEVHRLIETRDLRFVLTGSSARKLRGKGVNLLAGRALTLRLHPLTASELGAAFDIGRALRHGTLPTACTSEDPGAYLDAYAATYLREEVQQEGLTRRAGDFARFLEAASFSQGSVLNVASVARECRVPGKAAEAYFQILEDLLLAVRVPVFARRAKRRMSVHPKFYLFDPGVFRAVRPRGPLDPDEALLGPAFETLCLHHLRAANDYGDLGYGIHYWRTAAGTEVDFVLYGESGLHAVEVQNSSRVRDEDLHGLLKFRADYPEARCVLVRPAGERRHDRGVDILPFADFARELPERLG
jgi:predicted AAA+ superfamily ATPase